MDIARKSLSQAFNDIFELFAIEGNRVQSTFKRCFLITFNIAVPVIFLAQYILEENVFISVDPLSQATDLFELFTPIVITSYMIIKYCRNRKVFRKICDAMENLDDVLTKENSEKFEKITKNSMLIYAMKFFVIHAVGIGFDSFMMIT